jgi:hypothetical protein
MKKLAVAAVAGMCLMLSGCEGSALSDLVKQVQEKTVQLCQYLPETTAVTAMLSASNPTFVGVSAIANAICSAVVKWQEQPKNAITSECPKVNGVCVTGSFQH